jgi:hypothetical protein
LPLSRILSLFFCRQRQEDQEFETNPDLVSVSLSQKQNTNKRMLEALDSIPKRFSPPSPPKKTKRFIFLLKVVGKEAERGSVCL